MEMGVGAQVDGGLIFGVLLVDVGSVVHQKDGDSTEGLLSLTEIQVSAQQGDREGRRRRKRSRRRRARGGGG